MQQCNMCDEYLHKQEVCRLNSDGEGSEAQHCGVGVGGEGMGGHLEQGIMGGNPEGREGWRFLATAPVCLAMHRIDLSRHAKAETMG